MKTINWEGSIDLTKELIAINSTVLSGKERIIEYIANALSGIDVEIVQHEGVDPYLIATIKPDSGDPIFRLILEGHLDTVPPGMMEKPFCPTIKHGKLYGRGASDMKSGCAAMVYALKKYAELSKNNGLIQLVLVTDEETESKGIVDALENHHLAADLAMVGEPTQLAIGVAHKGIEWIEVSFMGCSSHASKPELGQNAIEMASRFIILATDYARNKFPDRIHDICGLPTINIGTISGGGPHPNIVPDKCTIKIDRRWNPNESIEDVWHDVEACLAQCEDEQPGFKGVWKRIGISDRNLYPPLFFDTKNPKFKLVAEALGKTGLNVDSKGLSYWTEGSLLQMYGIPTLIFGPGSIDCAHSAHEYVETSQIALAAKSYYKLLTSACLLEI